MKKRLNEPATKSWKDIKDNVYGKKGTERRDELEREFNSKMEINIHKISCQFYIIPFVKVTYDKVLNGSYELIIGWFNIGLSISYKPKQR